MKKHRILQTLSILYLVIPVCLWLHGWVEPWLSIPLICGLVMCTILIHLHHNVADTKKYTLAVIGICLFMAAGAVFLCGLDGRLPQSYDLYMRNPLYQTLIDSDWPSLFPDGRNVLYPVQFWLAPALLSKLLPDYATFVLQVWCILGIFLALLHLREEMGLFKTVLLFFVLLLFSPLTKLIDDFLNVILHVDVVYGVHMRMPGVFSQLINTYHYFTLVLLMASMLFNSKLGVRTLVLASAMFAAMNPIAASMVLPILLWRIFGREGGAEKRIKMLVSLLKSPECWIGMVVAALSLVYYSSAQTSSFRLIFDAPYAPACNVRSVLILASAIILTIMPLVYLGVKLKMRLVISLACCYAFILIVQYGGYNGSNEWLYKTSVLYALVVLYAVAKLPRKAYLVWTCAIVVVSLLPFLREIQYKKLPEAFMSGFAVQPKYINNEWNGTFYHPELYDYWYFTTDVLKMPFVFKKPTAVVPQEKPITAPSGD